MESIDRREIMSNELVQETGLSESTAYLKNLKEKQKVVPCFCDESVYEPFEDNCFGCIFLREREYLVKASDEELKTERAKYKGSDEAFRMEDYHKVVRQTIYCPISGKEKDKVKTDVEKIKSLRVVEI